VIFRTRFAPSPTGPLHLGHAYSALLAYRLACQHNGQFLLRIEDIDQSRARPEWEAQIYDDLAWLGLTWETPVMRQSDRLEVYDASLRQLWDRGLLFACTCTRRDILDALSAPQEGAAPPTGPDGLIYPGTCRHRKRSARIPEPPATAALRLDMAAAVEALGPGLCNFIENGAGPQGETGSVSFDPTAAIETIGDIVLARRDMGTSYHLSVVIDDAAQEISHVLRGRDLFEATYIHLILQRLFDLSTPQYHHHRLIRDTAGKRLAKRDDARALSTYRREGLSPADIVDLIGL
jgi:glutamyl-Q tRNA(Asp) synthetase